MDEELKHLSGQIRAGRSAQADTGIDAIPILTEVVGAHDPTTGAGRAEPGEALGAQALDALEALDTIKADRPAALERLIVERVLERLLGQPGLLDEAVRDAIHAASERLVDALSIEIASTVELALRKALVPAVNKALVPAVKEVLAPALRGALDDARDPL